MVFQIIPLNVLYNCPYIQVFLLGFNISIFLGFLNILFSKYFISFSKYLKFIYYLMWFMVLYLLLLYILNILGCDLFNTIYLEGEKEVNLDVSVKGNEVDIKDISIKTAGEIAGHIGGAGVFAAGLKVGASLVKNSSLPIGLKIGLTSGTGLLSFLLFNTGKATVKLFENNKLDKFNSENHHIIVNKKEDGEFTAEVTDTGKNDNNFTWNKSPNENELDLDQVLEVLTGCVNINMCIVFILTISIIFLVFKWMSQKHYNLDWTDKIIFGKILKSVIQYFLKTWSNSSSLFGFFGLLIVWFGSIINTIYLKLLLDYLDLFK